jgi:U11/U12 small nuclear ribonucleoprotein SNRNP48
MYTEASTWLASWLIHLYGPVNSKALVLGVLKHCLKACGRFLSDLPKPEDLKVFHLVPDSACIDNSNVEEILEVKQAGSAMDALYERTNFERYMKSLLVDDNLTRFQRNDNYDKMVHFAFNERAKRPNYRAVIEHDGLTWQPSQQEEKRNKTKAELLAEERDYKRRRMSYRGKKLKRTPLQVLHDIIENHMTQIIAAGGIGSFSKQPLPDPSVSHTKFESQQQGQGSIPKTPSFHPHFESAYRSRTIDTDMAANMPRPYDDHREASSVSGNDFRSRSRSRYDNERHYDSRR